ncbi:MAG: SnoaL-like domain-containing protein [Thiohalocapsa sp. PB-PSB1]|jgi:ketosteroid isomerase-like protein|nr:MAG: SnoaL-like domain-containing protein [Thiohalocapsa sp. PB-PSB1]
MNKQAVTALVLATSFSAGAALAEVEQATIDSIKTLWQQQHKALDQHNVDAVLATYTDSDDIMLMGTGPGEHWVGQAEVKDAYTHFLDGFDANTMQVTCGDGSGSSRGEVVWLTGVCSFNDKKGGEERKFVTNISAVLVKRGDDWRFHTMHFSHLTDGDQNTSQDALE